MLSSKKYQLAPGLDNYFLAGFEKRFLVELTLENNKRTAYSKNVYFFVFSVLQHVLYRKRKKSNKCSKEEPIKALILVYMCLMTRNILKSNK